MQTRGQDKPLAVVPWKVQACPDGQPFRLLIPGIIFKSGRVASSRLQSMLTPWPATFFLVMNYSLSRNSQPSLSHKQDCKGSVGQIWGRRRVKADPVPEPSLAVLVNSHRRGFVLSSARWT